MALGSFTAERHMESMLTSWLQRNTEIVWQPHHYIVIYPVGCARFSLQKRPAPLTLPLSPVGRGEG